MKTFIASLIMGATIWGSASALQAREPFVYRPNFTQQRQNIAPRTPTYTDYYLRKYGRLPPFAPVVVVPAEPALPPGYNWSDLYVPGFGYVPDDGFVY